MLQLERSPEATVIRTASYRLVIDAGERRYVRLEVPPGRPLADLVLLSSAHPRLTIDELVEIGEIIVREGPDGLVDVVQEARGTL